MDNNFSQSLTSLLQSSNRQVWIQASGRSLYQAGYGLIQFYIPLIFVNQIGLSATSVGISVGSGSLAGVVGHLLGGYLADSPNWGRKRTLLLSAGLSILSALVLAISPVLPILVIANLLLGLSAGCYWTAADASVMDATTSEHRHQAFAILSLADSLGGGVGVLGGGLVLTLFTQAQKLFLVVSFLFLVLWVLFQLALAESQSQEPSSTSPLQGFSIAIQDNALKLFVSGNILFTTYIALISSTLPLYLTYALSVGGSTSAATEASFINIATLFTWCYVGFGALMQLPIVQLLGSLQRVQVLMLSMLLWGAGFLLVWVTGLVNSLQTVWVIAALCMLSVSATIYKPFAPTIVAELAPVSLRGVYVAISYQCWSIGYFIGPILGGWAMDQSLTVAHNSWLIAAATTIVGLIILQVLNQAKFRQEIETHT